MTMLLHGYRYSVYSWIARLALVEKAVAYRWIEIDPFAPEVPAAHLSLHPFKRVPVLQHDGFTLYETGAITRYIDEACPGCKLQPDAPAARARLNQIMSVVDSYAYWPLVRQVFSHRVFRPRFGLAADEAEAHAGLQAAVPILSALEVLATDGRFLCGDDLTLADIHLAPMLDYFAADAEAAGVLRSYDKLHRWTRFMQTRPAFAKTRPQLPA